MTAKPRLNEEQQKIAAAYTKTGRIPSDPQDARILANLIASGKVKETKPKSGAAKK